ncbi:cold-regulated protein 27 [Ziziphus jujuba]|uniref:Cold-regulated protein 27 n=2 Tax=Ziziphus jujuba TaxID=326968 RepID=A0A6P3ZSY5_ZIZJJ|nr:cold-regulated protein 27 [Ziziphus jujuba]KAH7523627.1 hypothetical protein FEM48_Zijuj06G0032100 [Ziziphus jujuba var. spinosa]
MDDFTATHSRPDPQSSGFSGDSSLPSTLQRTPEASEFTSTEWTNEKHSMYLKSMETSFVKQLYDSMDLLGWRSKEGKLSHSKSSRRPYTHSRAPSGQFKVLRRGGWQNIKFERPESTLKKTEETCDADLLSNRWIRHYRSVCKDQDVGSRAVPERFATITRTIDSEGKEAILLGADSSPEQQLFVGQSHLCNTIALEVSDQNFVGEDIEGEKKTSGKCSAKRVKTRVVHSSSNDQVVPLRKPPPMEDAGNNCIPADL